MPLPRRSSRSTSPSPIKPHHPAPARPRRSSPWHLSHRSGQLISVWPVAQEVHPDAVSIPGWLMNTIVQIVITYTLPGHRVLLLAAPAQSGESLNGCRQLASPRPAPAIGLLTGLIEAAGTAARLGRTIEARTAGLVPGAAPGATDPTIQLESVDRSTCQSVPSAPTGNRPPPHQGRPNAPGPDSFDAVIAAVDPQSTDWTLSVPWGALLAPSGTLAFVTHGDYVLGRWTDPTNLLTGLAHHAGLAEIDRIALLQVPIRNGAFVGHRPAGVTSPSTAAAGSPRHTRVHSDLLVYTRPETLDAKESGR